MSDFNTLLDAYGRLMFNGGIDAESNEARAAVIAEYERVRKVQADYDRWLSKGTYFTSEEYLAHLEKHRAELAAERHRADGLREALRGALHGGDCCWFKV